MNQFNVETALPVSMGLLVAGAWAAFWFLVFQKAGFRAGPASVLTLGMLLPPFTIIVAIYFILARWPVQAELASLRCQAGVDSEEDAWTALAEATSLESKGDSNGALAGYRAIVEHHGGTTAGRDAAASLKPIGEDHWPGDEATELDRQLRLRSRAHARRVLDEARKIISIVYVSMNAHVAPADDPTYSCMK
jgi:hypothetical protein